MKIVRFKSLNILFFIVLLSLVLITSVTAQGRTDYKAMVDEMGIFFNDALTLYKEGNIQGAKSKAQAAYFEVFENLEGPIRINISAKKNFELEEEFAGIRKMIVNGEDFEAVEKRIRDLMVELRVVVSELGGGVEIVAESTEELAKKEAIDKDWPQVSANLFDEIEKATSIYEKGEKNAAVTLVQDTYFDVFEGSGMEAKIGARDADLKAKLEGHFSKVVGQMKKGVPEGDIQETITEMRKDFEKAVSMLGKGVDSPMVFFFYSLIIILREGVEAILIITAIIAYLIKTEHRDKLGVIYNGCIVALILSVLTAILVKWVFKVSAASQEILEGATMLLATVVLFSVSYWLISKAHAQKWMAYIKGKVSGSLSSGSLSALWFAAFLAVYREGAETVLFYQALVSDATGSGITAIMGGFGLGCALLVGVYLAMRYGAVRLPIRPFFVATGVLLYYMAFVFAGKGVMELVEGKLFEPSLISWVPTISFVGLYPYWETLIPQILLVFAALAGMIIIMRQKVRLS